MKVAVLCGGGELPKLSITALLNQNIETVAIVFDDEKLATEIRGLVDTVYCEHIGKVGKILSLVKKEKATHVFMVGKVHINVLEGKLRPDFLAVRLLLTLKERTTNAIMLTLINEFKKNGIETLDQSVILSGILSNSGVFTDEKPTDDMLDTVKYAYQVALTSSVLDVGQTVVAKDSKIVAIEAAEGTDKAVARGCELANGGAIVVKVAGAKDDNRFDLPTVGLDTLKIIAKNGGKMLAIESGLTIVVNKDECIKFANDNGLIFMAFDKNEMGK